MIDFTKRLRSQQSILKTDPLEIYESLDRTSEKGPLRPAQQAILNDWFEKFKDNKDLIIKLHTGQGKTLIGLLILQSKLNQGSTPVMYVCPNKYLAKQTCEQAKQFGIKFCQIDDISNMLPVDFEDGKAILITHAQKVFNGKTIFKTGSKSIEIDSIILDDSHACIDIIKSSFTIKILKDEKPFNELINLFESDLSEQGLALFEEIKNEVFDSFLPVPYWAWQDKLNDVAKLLALYKEENNSIKFPWELIKNRLKDCQCIISGNYIEITPYFNPIELFGSFHNAKHRVLMSATTNNDSFFIKGLGFTIESIKNPLKYEKEKWSGEKMILIPYFMDYNMDRTSIVNFFAKPNSKRKYGIVALTPSNKSANYWEGLGSTKAELSNIDSVISKLKSGFFENTVVITNRYDGIDLPDDSCRILVFDSKPYSESLYDNYHEQCRVNSDLVNIKIAQKIEQGIGRGVRGEKDYCVVIINGSDLISTIRNKKLQKFFSSQTKKQIEIGSNVTQFVVEEIQTSEKEKSLALVEVMNQCLNRDEGWKNYYYSEMDSIERDSINEEILSILQLEKIAEDNYAKGNIDISISSLRKIIEEYVCDEESEKGWYLQEMARYTYTSDKVQSDKLQIEAHKKNNYLLKPRSGITFHKLQINQTRVEAIRKFISQYDNFTQLFASIDEELYNLRFGEVKSEKFERSWEMLGIMLGFGSNRPDKYLNEGPDNLWNLNGNDYMLFECKNEVKNNRDEIYQSESGQMNNSCAWFKDKYPGSNYTAVMIIPTNNLAKGAGFNEPVSIIRTNELNKLTKAVRQFYADMKSYDIHNISDKQLNDSLKIHKLEPKDFKSEYLKEVYSKK